MHGENLVVGFLPQEAIHRQRKLRADQQGENAGEHEEQERCADVINADEVVVDRLDVVEALRRAPDALQLLKFSGRPLFLGRKAVIEIVVEPRFALHGRLSSQEAIASTSAAVRRE
jgi:hypothetical protein